MLSGHLLPAHAPHLSAQRAHNLSQQQVRSVHNEDKPSPEHNDAGGPLAQAVESLPSSGVRSNSMANQTKQMGLILEELQQNKRQVNQIMEWISHIRQKEEGTSQYN